MPNFRTLHSGDCSLVCRRAVREERDDSSSKQHADGAAHGLGWLSAFSRSGLKPGQVGLVLQHQQDPTQHPKYRVVADSDLEASQWIEGFQNLEARASRHAPTARSSKPNAKGAARLLGRARAVPAGKAAALLGPMESSEPLLAGQTQEDADHGAQFDSSLVFLEQRLEAVHSEKEDLERQRKLLVRSLSQAQKAMKVAHAAVVDAHAQLGLERVQGRPPAEAKASWIEEMADLCQALTKSAESLQAAVGQTPMAPASSLQRLANDTAGSVALDSLAAAADTCAMMQRFPLASALAGQPILSLVDPLRANSAAPHIWRHLPQVAAAMRRGTAARVPLSPLAPPSSCSAREASQQPDEAQQAAEPSDHCIRLTSPAQVSSVRAALEEARLRVAQLVATDGEPLSDFDRAVRVAEQLGKAAADAFLARVAAAVAAIDELPKHNGLQALRSYFALYAPQRVGEEAVVLSEFAGREEALFAMLERMYLRPVRVPYVPLSSLPLAPGLVLQPHWRPQHWEQWRAHVAVQEVVDTLMAAAKDAHDHAPYLPAAVQAQVGDVHTLQVQGGGQAATGDVLTSLLLDGAGGNAPTPLQRSCTPQSRCWVAESLKPSSPVAEVCRGGWLLRSHFVKRPPVHEGFTSDAPEWIPNTAAAGCQICSAAFGLMQRPHHCRSCARVVCGSCAPAPGTTLQLSHATPRRVRLPEQGEVSGQEASVPGPDADLIWRQGQGECEASLPSPDTLDGEARDCLPDARPIAGKALPEMGYHTLVRVCVDCISVSGCQTVTVS